MADLADRLRRLADADQAVGADEVMRRARRALSSKENEPVMPSSRSGRRWALTATSAVVVLVAGAAIWLAASNGDDSPSVVTDGRAEEGPVPDGSATGEPLYLVPTHLSDDLQLLEVSGGDQPGFAQSSGGSNEWDRIQRWIRFDDARSEPREYFDVSWGPSRGVNTLASFGGEPVTVRGQAGVHNTTNGWLAWLEPDGRLVLVAAGATVDPVQMNQQPASLAELQQIAESLERRSDGGFTVSDPPDDFELMAEWPGFGTEGTNPRTITYRSNTGRGFQVQIVDATEQPPGINLYFSTARLVDVRGNDAVLGTRFFSGGGFNQVTAFLAGADLHLQWIEPNGSRVTIRSVGLDQLEMLDIANSLEIADQQHWDQLRAEAGGAGASPPPSPTAQPPSLGETETEIADVFLLWINAGENVDQIVQAIDGGEELRGTIEEALASAPNPPSAYSGRIESVELTDDNHALVRYSILLGDAPVLTSEGAAIRVDGRWLVSRNTYCSAVQIGEVRCPSL